jgi:hypothetical protein
MQATPQVQETQESKGENKTINGVEEQTTQQEPAPLICIVQ